MSFRKTISWCLFPLTMWYPIGVGFRNLLFSMGIRKQRVTPITSIGIGNLSTGGTGKTPHVEYLIRLLGNDFSIALLSRGYRRKSKGFVVADDSYSTAEMIGDEPAMIAHKYPHITTAVCESRNEGISQLAAMEEAPQLVILDDVYQHRQTKPTVNILLTEFQRPYYKDHVLPFGNLRESARGHERANIIIVTKSPEQLNPIVKHSIVSSLKVLPYQKVFFSYLRYGVPTSLDGRLEMPFGSFDSAVIVTGIAHPEPMLKYVERYCRKNSKLQYSDHHAFTSADVAEMKSRLDQLQGSIKIILTTEKDAARMRSGKLQEAFSQLPIYYLPIEVAFHENKEYNFDETITALVKENISFLSKLNSSRFCC